MAKRRKRAVAAAEENLQLQSSYRIFSRAACNFTFPLSLPRPLPTVDKNVPANLVEAIQNIAVENGAVTAEDAFDNVREREDDADAAHDTLDDDYQRRQAEVMKALTTEIVKDVTTESGEIKDVEVLGRDGLRIYSPKYLRILENIENPDHKGLHLVYSNFRTMEGIGILKLVLMKNGFSELKIHKNVATGEWELNELDTDPTRPRFVTYTGTETAQEKEVIRNIYNSNWSALSPLLRAKLTEIAPNNHYGEVVKVLMITASGAEGINLENTRYVHIVEPYWHLVRIEQVVGRARRICSHKNLPEDLRTVEVFLYITQYSKEQLDNASKYIKAFQIDTNEKLGKAPLTTDGYLYSMAALKDKLNMEFLTSIKETSIDCSLYAAANAAENMKCYDYGAIESNNFGTFPTVEDDVQEKQEINMVQQTTELKKIGDAQTGYYIFNPATKEIFEYYTYVNTKKLVRIGEVDKTGRVILI